MEELLNYLYEQKAEREEKITAYNAAQDELKAAQEKVAAFGDVSGICAEIDRLNGFIESVSGNIAHIACGDYSQGEVAEEQESGGAADGDVTVEA